MASCGSHVRPSRTRSVGSIVNPVSLKAGGETRGNATFRATDILEADSLEMPGSFRTASWEGWTGSPREQPMASCTFLPCSPTSHLAQKLGFPSSENLAVQTNGILDNRSIFFEVSISFTLKEFGLGRRLAADA